MELVTIVEGKALTSSRTVASFFEKEHKTVLRAIENVECTEDFRRHNFALSSYINLQGKKQPEYSLTRDGWTLVAMGFTGKEAAKFKEEYIAAFNEMEQRLMPTGEELVQRALLYQQQQIERLQIEKDLANKTIADQAPKVKYVEEVLDSSTLIATTIIAKDLGMSATALNKKLKALKVIYWRNPQYVFYADYQGFDYGRSKTYTYHDKQNIQQTTQQLYWTEKGREFINRLLNRSLSA